MTTQKAQLYPHLDLENRASRRAATYARIEDGFGILGNGLLETRIPFKAGPTQGAEFHHKGIGETFGLDYRLFQAWFEDTKLTDADATIGEPAARGSADVSSVGIRLQFDAFAVDVSYVLARGNHFFQKLAVIHSVQSAGVLRRVTLFAHHVHSEYTMHIHDAGMYFPVVFLRGERAGMFYFIDYPGYFAETGEDSFEFFFYPGQRLEPGRSFQSQTAHIGVCELTDRYRKNPYHESGAEMDVGEVQWFQQYLHRSAGTAILPEVEVVGRQSGRCGPSELEVLDQCALLGARYVVLPPMLNNPDAYPLLRPVLSRMAAKKVYASMVLARETGNNLSWVALAENGAPMDAGMGACFGSVEFCEYLVEQSVQQMERYGFRQVQLRGAPIVTCHSSGHNHAPGVESLQTAFHGLVEVVAALKESGGMLSCAGAYASYGAGAARLFDSVGLMADDHPLPLPDLHIGRLFGDMNRLYARRSMDFLLPKAKLVNSIGPDPESLPDAQYPGAEHYPWYLYHDRRGWRYSLISALATGLRHRFHAVSPDLSEEDQQFAQEWLGWERSHVDLLHNMEPILDEPGLGPVDGYCSVTPRSAVVFLFNTTYDEQSVTLEMRLEHDSEYVVREIYPRAFNYRGAHEGLYRRHDAIETVLSPREARIVEIVRRSPASARRSRPEVFGAPGASSGRSVQVYGESGTQTTVGLRCDGSYREEEVTFPGQVLNPHLRNWFYRQDAYEAGAACHWPAGEFEAQPLGEDAELRRNVWLRTEFAAPADLPQFIDTSPFNLYRPCWTFDDRLFFVVRFEPRPAFDPIRTSSETPGVPENYRRALPRKYGIDLAFMNLGLRAWVNNTPCPVYPALAAWKGYAPNPQPVVAYYFEAGSKLHFGGQNTVVLFAAQFDANAFRGVYMEHAPERRAAVTLECT